LLRNNQYLPTVYEPIIKKTLETIESLPEHDIEEKEEEKLLLIEYLGKILDKFKQSLRKCHVPCKVIFTLRKLKALKPPVDKSLRSSLVYQICCPRCNACYVGQICRDLLIRFKEHRRSPMCHCELSIDDVNILAVSLS